MKARYYILNGTRGCGAPWLGGDEDGQPAGFDSAQEAARTAANSFHGQAAGPDSYIIIEVAENGLIAAVEGV